MNYEAVYQPDPDEYQQLGSLIRDFVRQPRPKIYENIFAQRIATAGSGAKLYVVSMIVYIIVSSIIITAMGRQYTDILGSTGFEPENLPLVIMNQCQMLIVIVFYFIMFAGLVHVGSTAVMRGHGEFDKMIFALFAVLSVGVVITTFLYIVLFILAQLGSSSYAIIRVVWGLLSLASVGYLLYCYLLSVKTVYRFSWVRAIGGGIIVPFMILGSCAGALIYVWSGN